MCDRVKVRPVLFCALVCFTLCPLAVFAQTAEPTLSPDDESRVRELVIAQRDRIGNLFVNVDSQSVEGGVEYGGGGFEWAFSGPKAYRKNRWPAAAGKTPSGRWGLAAWNGQVLKTFDSEIGNGAVRSDYDPKDSAQSKTYTDYAQLLGHITKGPLADLLREVPAEKWRLFWTTPEKNEVVFQSTEIGPSAGAQRHSWTLDLGRGGMITRYEIAVGGSGQPYVPRVTWTILEASEVEPGLWLPTRAEQVADFSNPGRPLQIQKTLTVKELRVNDPSIESYFEFQFPSGSLYYNHIQGGSRVAGFPKGKVGPGLDHEVAALREIIESDQGAASSRPDDFEIADRLLGKLPATMPTTAVGSKSGHPAGQTGARSDRWATWVILVGVGVAILAWTVSRRLGSRSAQGRA